MVNKTLKDYQASIRILKMNIDLFYSGFFDAYRVIAAELRKLLCDSHKGQDISLLPRVFIEFKPHQLHNTDLFRRHPSLLDGMERPIPGRLHMLPTGVKKFELLFDEPVVRLNLNEWLDQPFFSKDITIRELVRSVADKEAAHSDPVDNDTLTATRSYLYGGETESHIFAVVGIAEYILAVIEHESPSTRPELLTLHS